MPSVADAKGSARTELYVVFYMNKYLVFVYPFILVLGGCMTNMPLSEGDKIDTGDAIIFGKVNVTINGRHVVARNMRALIGNPDVKISYNDIWPVSPIEMMFLNIDGLHLLRTDNEGRFLHKIPSGRNRIHLFRFYTAGKAFFALCDDINPALEVEAVEGQAIYIGNIHLDLLARENTVLLRALHPAPLVVSDLEQLKVSDDFNEQSAFFMEELPNYDISKIHIHLARTIKHEMPLFRRGLCKSLGGAYHGEFKW